MRFTQKHRGKELMLEIINQCLFDFFQEVRRLNDKFEATTSSRFGQPILTANASNTAVWSVAFHFLV